MLINCCGAATLRLVTKQRSYRCVRDRSDSSSTKALRLHPEHKSPYSLATMAWGIQCTALLRSKTRKLACEVGPRGGEEIAPLHNDWLPCSYFLVAFIHGKSANAEGEKGVAKTNRRPAKVPHAFCVLAFHQIGGDF